MHKMKNKNLFNPTELRRRVLQMAFSGNAVHVGCAFSTVEIMSTLYQDFLRFPDNDLNHPDRDYFVLSKTAGVMTQYACFYELGWLLASDLSNYCADGTHLWGGPDEGVPGIEATTGSLGHGLPIASGIAFGLKMQSKTQKVYVLVGDGEMNEGSNWEAMLFAAQRELDNLVVIVDLNGFQAMGKTADILDLSDMGEKFLQFGFEVSNADGHNMNELSAKINEFLCSKNKKPKALIAKTVKGKGVDFMEGNNDWHYKRLDEETYNAALRQLVDH